MKPWIKRTVAFSLTATLLGSSLPFRGLAVPDPSHTSGFNHDGVWLTEIYQNDIKRTGMSAEYDPIVSYATDADLMEFLELTSTYDNPIDLNEQFDLYYGDTKLTITDLDGNDHIQIAKGQPVILWNRRTDLEPNLTEADFRTAMRVPDHAQVLQITNAQNWSADNSTFTIKRSSDQSIVSQFTCRDKIDTMDGLSVELKIPDLGSDMQIYRALTLPNAGFISYDQGNGLLPRTTDTPEKGVYVTEIRPNDTNRSAQYGVDDDLMEYFELVNTTDQPVDLNTEYSLKYVLKEGQRKSLPVYHYAEQANDFSSDHCVIPAGGTAILWCYRSEFLSGYSSFPTEADFRSAYGIPESVPVYLFTNQNGMGNSNRAIEVYKRNEDNQSLVSSYTYIGNSDCKDNRSVELAIRPEGPEMQIYAANATSTPGSIAHEQLTPPTDDGSSLQLDLADTVPDSIPQGSDLRVKFECTQTGSLPRTAMETYCRYDGEGAWHSVSASGQLRQMDGKVQYTATINANDLFDHHQVEFYVKASNAYRSTFTPIYSVELLPLNVTDDIRINLEDGQVVSGILTATANSGTNQSATQISLDGVPQTTFPVLEDGAYFNFVTSGRDSYFRNAITTTKNEWIAPLGQWLDTILDGQSVHIDNRYFTYQPEQNTYNVTLRFWAGTWLETVENNLVPGANREDFKATNLKLSLINGHEYLPTAIGPDDPATKDKTNLSTEYDAVHDIGDSSGMCPYMDVSFQIPAADATAMGAQIDTTALSDGVHTLSVTNANKTKTISFRVDNQKPVIDLKLEPGSVQNGVITLNPSAQDESELASFTVLLDGSAIELPYETTAYRLGKGEHTLSAYAVDAAGNETVASAAFTVTDPALTLLDMGAKDITDTSAQLYLDLDSVSETETHFYRAQRIDTARIETNTADGILPYIEYTLDVSALDPSGTIHVQWNGSASNADSTHAETMYVRNLRTGQWEEVGRADADGNIQPAVCSLTDHVDNGTVSVLVQCTADSALPTLNSQTNGMVGQDDPNANWDGSSAPADYDFAFAWETDTQYYTEQWQHHFRNMNHWIRDNAEAQKIKYVIHTGDIVDDYDMLYQWENADEAMGILDDAEIPYGVLGGNHDVAAGLGDYENYNHYFGEDRFSSKPYYGGSYDNNKGHYDLISEGGQDFIFVYMSWDINQQEIDWMNEVLQQYSDRKAILCFHTYLRAAYSNDMLIDYFGELIQREVVAKNPNVFAVLNGHYHGSSYQTEFFDDDQDGVKERVVYQICTDYQSGFEGGSGYIKMLYFDLDNNKIYVNSYSPSLDDYNFYDDKEVVNLRDAAESNQGLARDVETDKAILDVPFHTDPGQILEHSMSAYWETGEELDPTPAELTPHTTYSWYATAENADGASLTTPVSSFTTQASPVPPAPGAGGTTERPESFPQGSNSIPSQGSDSAPPSSNASNPKTGDQTLWELPMLLCGLLGLTTSGVWSILKAHKKKDTPTDA